MIYERCKGVNISMYICKYEVVYLVWHFLMMLAMWASSFRIVINCEVSWFFVDVKIPIYLVFSIYVLIVIFRSKIKLIWFFYIGEYACLGVGGRIERFMMRDGIVCMSCCVLVLLFWGIRYVFEIHLLYGIMGVYTVLWFGLVP